MIVFHLMFHILERIFFPCKNYIDSKTCIYAHQCFLVPFFQQCSATCSTANRAPSRGLSGSTFTSAVWAKACNSATLPQAPKAPCRGKTAIHGRVSFLLLVQLTSSVTKRACCWGLSGFTFTVWLDLNSCSSASLLQA